MKLKINPIEEEKAGYDLSRLTGRVIFSVGENYDYEGEIDFFCGPEEEDHLSDLDCGLYPQLEKLFKKNNLEVEVGAAENYHVTIIPNGKTADEVWKSIKAILEKAGAVEVNTQY